MDYRESHQTKGKGKTYHEAFSRKNHRAFIWLWEQKVLDMILQKHLSSQRIKYLDFACGTGRITRFMESKVYESQGVDVSEEMLEVGRKNVSKSILTNVDLTKNNIFYGQKFNLITTFRFFLKAQPELRKDVATLLANLLHEDGYFVFNIHMNSRCSLAMLYRLYGFFVGRERVRFNSMSEKDVSDLISKVGLKIVDKYYMGVFPVKDEKTVIPIPVISAIESVASKSKLCDSFAQHMIFVCRKI